MAGPRRAESPGTTQNIEPSGGRADGFILAEVGAVDGRFNQGATILLVDDNPSVRSLVTRFLARDGVVVITEDNGAAALEVGRRYGAVIDLLITDVQMAGLDGITFALEFTIICPKARVLLMTGFWSPRLEALWPGMRCLVKPFSQRQLRAAVTALLSPGGEERADDGTHDGR